MYTKFNGQSKLNQDTEYICVVGGFLKPYYKILTWYNNKKVVGYDFKGKGFYDYDSEYGYCKCNDVVAYQEIEPYI